MMLELIMDVVKINVVLDKLRQIIVKIIEWLAPAHSYVTNAVCRPIENGILKWYSFWNNEFA